MSKPWPASGLLLLALAGCAGPPRSASPAPAFTVVLPTEKAPFPTPLPPDAAGPGFALRGTKGWAWTWDQYLAEIPTLVAGRMNFLMSCYTSVFADPVRFVNRWWEPLPPETLDGLGRVARACRDTGITFCFSFHPALFSDRPLRTASDEDFEAMARNYDAVQALGVRWFSLSYDDIDVRNADKASLGADHARLANRLLRRLRTRDPRAELIFCPVYYWGPADQGEAQLYTEALGRTLDPDILVFWTGDGVVTPRITRRAAESFRRAVGHRIVVWDNYPVNDRTGALHLGPVVGRDPDLGEVATGYMSNPLSPQNEINRLPLLTCADYAWNPRAYDPARSIGQAILLQAETPGQRAVLKDLVELYPGNLILGSTSTAYNGLFEGVDERLKKPNGRDEAAKLVDRAASVAARLEREFPGRYAATKATLFAHLARARDMIAAAGRPAAAEGRRP